MGKDPVCGMEVNEKTAKYKTTHKGKTYYFCAPGCQKAFEANPQNPFPPDLKGSTAPETQKVNNLSVGRPTK